MIELASKSLYQLSLALVLSLLIVLPPAAYAHPDFLIVDTTLQIAPRDFVEFSLPVHYHRVVGSFKVVNPIESTITVLLMDDQAFTGYKTESRPSQLYSSGEAGEGALNILISCCFEQGDIREQVDFIGLGSYARTYTKYHLIIENSDSAPTTVRLRLNLIHDDLAIVLYGAEPGAELQAAGFFAAVGVVMVLHIRRSIRRPATAVVESKLSHKLTLPTLGTEALFASASAIGLGLAIFGNRSYGGSLLEGLVASVADLSLPPSLFGSSFGFLIAILAIPWIFAVFLWLKGFGIAVKFGSKLVGSIGIVEGVASLLVGSLLALNYGSILLPAMVAAIVGLPQIFGGLYLLRKSRWRQLTQ